MPIEVEAPNGDVVEFPDGTSDAVMARAMRQAYGGPPPTRSALGRDVGGALESINRGFPFARDFQGVLAGVGRAASPVFSAVIGSPDASLPRIGQEFQRGYRDQVGQSEATADDFMQRRPLAANFAEGTGAAIPLAAALAASGGTATPAMIAARTQADASRSGGALLARQAGRGLIGNAGVPVGHGGLGTFLNQTGQSASVGSLWGEAYGAGDNEQAGRPLEERLGAGNISALFGAGFGVATPAAINTFGAATNIAQRFMPAATRLAEMIPTPAPNTVGAMGGNLFGAGRRPPLQAVPPAPPAGPRVPETAINMIDRLRDRSGMSVDQLGAAFAQARARPQGQVVADIFGDPGVRTTRAIAQGPGRTGQEARGVRRQRFLAAPDQIMGDLTRRLKVGESRAAAVSRLEGDYRALSANAYRPLWAREVTPEQLALYERDVAPLLSRDNQNPEMRRIMQRAQRDAEAQFNLDEANGIVEGALLDNLPRYLHYIKMQLGARASFEARPLAGTSGQRIGGLRQLYRRFGDLLDPGDGQPAIIPGYRDVTQRAADYHTLRDALDTGANWLAMSGEEVAASRAAMGDIELAHARIGLADEIRGATRGGTNRNVNVAARVDDPATQRAIANAFDTPEQAAEFLSLINGAPGEAGAPGLYQLLDNANQWGSGSTTFSNAAHGMDEGLHAGAEVAGNAFAGNPFAMLHRGAQAGINAITSGAIENLNNVRGQALLRRIDGPEAAAFTDEVMRIMRQREATRFMRTRAGVTGAAAASTTQGRRRR